MCLIRDGAISELLEKYQKSMVKKQMENGSRGSTRDWKKDTRGDPRRAMSTPFELRIHGMDGGVLRITLWDTGSDLGRIVSGSDSVK